MSVGPVCTAKFEPLPDTIYQLVRVPVQVMVPKVWTMVTPVISRAPSTNTRRHRGNLCIMHV